MTAIALRATGIGYPGRAAVLRDVHLDVAEGESVAVLGGNGAGKTALLRALVGLLPTPGGRVELSGRRVASPSDAVAAGAALVLQDPDDQLLGATLLDDVLFGPRNLGLPDAEARRRAEAALSAVHIAHLADRAIEALSFGERKRACIAGMLAMQPRVLLLDEPTAGLDPAGELALCATLRALSERQGATLVIATHAVDLVPLFAGRAILLGDGRILADGPPREVFARGELLERARLRRPWVAELWTRMAPPPAPGRAADLPLTLEEALACMTPVSC
ncbi:cobalt ABC transporter ATP-binding protein [Sorangium cellulosum]|uniref:Cobalt ABC transporter ATP-binding protein n=1 Tax=Sorangium cellulosum TaxID=56 RepID=A0A2L0EIR1_SORCE|nr:energy-coupling factor ABC transporter ATP-binding protein [Sorangium cellulosum]AUX39154.1 cobalt ABC transporter ATP-binding protein [Sorangium cellulosum]